MESGRAGAGGGLTELNDRDENRDPSRRQPITPPRRLRLHLESDAPTGVRVRRRLDRTKKAAIMREKTLDWGKKKRSSTDSGGRKNVVKKASVLQSLSYTHSQGSLAVSYGRG